MIFDRAWSRLTTPNVRAPLQGDVGAAAVAVAPAASVTRSSMTWSPEVLSSISGFAAAETNTPPSRHSYFRAALSPSGSVVPALLRLTLSGRGPLLCFAPATATGGRFP